MSFEGTISDRAAQIFLLPTSFLVLRPPLTVSTLLRRLAWISSGSNPLANPAPPHGTFGPWTNHPRRAIRPALFMALSFYKYTFLLRVYFKFISAAIHRPMKPSRRPASEASASRK
jgi:hypothetical protein